MSKKFMYVGAMLCVIVTASELIRWQFVGSSFAVSTPFGDSPVNGPCCFNTKVGEMNVIRKEFTASDFAQELKDNPNLERLHLGCTPIKDADLALLLDCPALQEVVLNNTDI